MELKKCSRGHYYNASIYSSCPKCESAGVQQTMPLDGEETAGKGGDIPKTTYMGYDGFRPVVGWLACVAGPCKGKSYEIKTDYNYIGRDSSMDIAIDDETISGENHANLGFDQEECKYLFGPLAGKSLVRVNGKAILNTVILNAYDRIEIGKTALLFIPLCGEQFAWEADGEE